jgi:hypothetical protein
VSSVLLLLPKDTNCDRARDVVVCGCGLPYMCWGATHHEF